MMLNLPLHLTTASLRFGMNPTGHGRAAAGNRQTLGGSCHNQTIRIEGRKEVMSFEGNNILDAPERGTVPTFTENCCFW